MSKLKWIVPVIIFSVAVVYGSMRLFFTEDVTTQRGTLMFYVSSPG